MAEGQDRRATYRIAEEKGTPYRRVHVTFLGHITVQLRWSDLEPQARAEVLNLCAGLSDVLRKCFIDLDVDEAAEGMDTELAELFKPQPPKKGMHQDVEDE